MSVLKLKTQGQVLVVERPIPLITSGNLNNDEVEVTFDDSWDCENGRFYASFYINSLDDAYIMELAPKEDRTYNCLIPNEMVEKEGAFNVGVWCETGNKRKTSDNKKIPVYQGSVTKGQESFSAVVEAIEKILQDNNIEGEDTVSKVSNMASSFNEIEKAIDESGVIEYDNSF